MIPLPFVENQCENPIFIKSQRIFVNCGKCDYCRNLWINDWATRLMMQKELSFLTLCCTLTYNNDNLPYHNNVPTLSKDDVQKFFKRFRKHLSVHYKDVFIQYFISGEYGSSLLRPHYHCIIFINTNNYIYNLYDFQTIVLKTWQKGYVQFSNTNNLSIKYLAKYIGKTTGISEYAEKHNLPLPFILMSRNPAIASQYLERGDNFAQHFRNLNDCHVHLPNMGNIIIPKYIRKKCTQHLPKDIKEKFYFNLQQEKIEKYEKWLENRRNRNTFNCNDIQLLNERSEGQYNIKQRAKQTQLEARYLEDLNLLNRLKK